MTPAANQWIEEIPWRVLAAVVALTGFGLIVLYSAAGGSAQPWAINQGVRFVVLFIAMLALSRLDMRFWLDHAYLIYGVVLVLLTGVELLGAVRGGSQRWLDLGIIRIQPSEFMKLAIILALARYYHHLPRPHLGTLHALVIPLAMIVVPAALVILQPDLGTAMMIMAGGVTILFLAGLPLRWFLGVGLVAAVALPLLYNGLHDYQKRRVLTFLDPSADPLGAGYHITQSKIAIGSGGMFGKGFLAGTQSHLDYLPELQTDFIFATMAEEWGIAGGIFILACYGIMIGWGLSVALSARAPFARLTAAGLAMTLFFNVAVNMLMVMGLAPVVGIPLPLFSYGGSAMMTVLILMGILMSVARDRERAHVGGLAEGARTEGY